MSVSHELQRHTSALQRNKVFYAGVDSLPVNSRPYARTHARTDTRTTITSDMQGMVWGEPERGSAQNGIWKCDGDESLHDSISSVSIASVYGTESC